MGTVLVIGFALIIAGIVVAYRRNAKIKTKINSEFNSLKDKVHEITDDKARPM